MGSDLNHGAGFDNLGDFLPGLAVDLKASKEE